MSGHTGTGGIRRYLERDGRALAVDLLNLGDPDLCEDWAAEMDRTRRLAGNDRAWGSRRARTFKHYVVSPSPEDGIGLGALRELATEWARRSFPDHEVAIVYHDDNQNHVPHAHVVVNNTNLETGRRLQDPDPGAMNGSLQEVSRELGLSHFRSRVDGGPRTDDHTQRRAEGRRERAISGRGGYSWVADIRSRVAVARDTSTSEREFLRALEGLGVVARPASARTGGGWVYQLAGMTSRQVSGARLGTAYTREGVRARMASSALPREVAFDAVAAARCATSRSSRGSLPPLRWFGRGGSGACAASTRRSRGRRRRGTPRTPGSSRTRGDAVWSTGSFPRQRLAPAETPGPRSGTQPRGAPPLQAARATRKATRNRSSGRPRGTTADRGRLHVHQLPHVRYGQVVLHHLQDVDRPFLVVASSAHRNRPRSPRWVPTDVRSRWWGPVGRPSETRARPAGRCS